MAVGTFKYYLMGEIVMLSYMKCSLLAVCLGFLLDMILGDPHTSWHPVCLIGRLVDDCEKGYRSLFQTEKGCHNHREVFPGAFTVITVVLVAAAVPCAILWGAYSLHTFLGIAVEAVLCYFMLAAKSLRDESMKVYDALKNEGLVAGRKAVSMIVGRDTERLDETGVTKAAVETIAENFSDGVAAPMFYMMLGGAGLMYLYKAINTMDSMLGYKNNQYYYFGRTAARLDDAANFIPARLSALFMILASFLTGLDGRNAIRIFKRDRLNHASPNSAQTEAVAAGALNVQLAGDAWYFGELYHKKTIGDDNRPVVTEDIKRANRLMYVAAVMALLILGGLKLCICMAVTFIII